MFVLYQPSATSADYVQMLDIIRDGCGFEDGHVDDSQPVSGTYTQLSGMCIKQSSTNNEQPYLERDDFGRWRPNEEG